MLAFFKSKPFLKDLLAGDYVDIHSHLLPGIDDGAKTIKKTVKLAKAFQELGISQFVTTPHINHYVWNNSEQDILEKLNYKLKLYSNGYTNLVLHDLLKETNFF